MGLENWDIKVLGSKNLFDEVLKKMVEIKKFDLMIDGFQKKIKKYKKIQLEALKIFS